MTERELEAMLAAMAGLEHDSDMQRRMCAKCGEDVTYWLEPCAEQGCPATKADA
jgi:hypothetical protein